MNQENRRMRFLIIGASGFIGSHIFRYARSVGHDVVGTRCGSIRPELVRFDLLHERISDCVARGYFEASPPVFAVICAAISQIDRCCQEREVSTVVNVVNTIRLIEDLKSRGAKAVFISTGSVYDGTAGYYDESRPPCPMNEYGRHKAAVEAFIGENVPDALVLRLDKIVGDDPAEKHLFSEWRQLVAANRPIVCIQGQLFSPTLVDDVARAAILSCELGLNGIYNVANPEFFSREELAQQFVSALDRKAEIVSKPQTAFTFLEHRPLKSYLDATKFTARTGMRFTSMREVFRSFIGKLP